MLLLLPFLQKRKPRPQKSQVYRNQVAVLGLKSLCLWQRSSLIFQYSFPILMATQTISSSLPCSKNSPGNWILANGILVKVM